jgi:hypothetical protein
MKVTVTQNTNTTASIGIGIQGPPGPPGNAITTAADVDTSNLSNGAVLVYKTTTNKWTSTTTLDAQNMEGGEF